MGVVKISFVGDIMCEKYTYKAMEKKDSYDFSDYFVYMEEKFAQSDYVIGNLETPLAGADAGYTNELYSFNTPDQIAKAIAASGVDFLSTANNHCLDRGIAGLRRTLDILDQEGIPHTGTYRTREEADNVFSVELGGQRFSIICCTGSTNYSGNKLILDASERYVIDLLHPQNMQFFKMSNVPLSKRKKLTSKLIPLETMLKLKRLLGKPVNNARADCLFNAEAMQPYLVRIKEKIKKAKQNSKVIVCPHIGGQFNVEPGECTKYIVDQLCEAGADAIVAAHVHIVQKYENRQGVPIAYCLGNYSISPNSVYLLHEDKPEYSIMLHLYFDGEKLYRQTFSVLKILEDKTLRVYPVEDLYQRETNERKRRALVEDVAFIYQRFTGKAYDYDDVRAEYDLG